jgi:hypothetical protein
MEGKAGYSPNQGVILFSIPDPSQSTSLAVLSGEEILKAVAFGGEMAGVELELTGG